MKKTIVVAGVVGLTALVTFAFILRRSDTDTGDYRFVSVDRGDVESTVTATGTLSAVSTVQVGTQVSGQIREIKVDFNDHVKKGELIARIDPTLLEQAVKDAQANLDRAKADLEQKKFLLDQAKPLYAQKVLTESDLKTAQYNEAMSEASLEAARSQLERAERNLDYTYIRAPVDGTVIERNVDVGQTVAASLSAPQLFLIAEDLSRMQILASVDESDIGQIQEGQPVRFTVQAWPDRQFTGTVRQVRLQSTTTENVVNYTVVVSVSNPDRLLLPGMTATVNFILADAKNVFTVPNAALRFRATSAMLEQLSREGGSAAAAMETTRGEEGTATHRAGFAGNAAGELGRSDKARLYYLDSDGALRVLVVRTGLTNGQVTQIEGEGLRDGLQVIAAVTGGAAAEEPAATTNPFAAPQRRGFRPGGIG